MKLKVGWGGRRYDNLRRLDFILKVMGMTGRISLLMMSTS
jgi:hypothetical protein